MRRKTDAWINATHILKIARFPKAKRTRILEKDVQTGIHEKVQGGYGKYQGTYVPLDLGIELATSFGVYEVLKPIFDFEYVEGKSVTPPPAPKHNHASASNVATRTNSLEVAKRTKSATNEPPRKRGRPKRVLEQPPKLKYNDTTPIAAGASGAGANSTNNMGNSGPTGPMLSRQNTESDALNAMANLQHASSQPYSSQFQVRTDDLEADTSDDSNDNDEEFISGKELFGTPRNSFERIVNHHNNTFHLQHATPQFRGHHLQHPNQIPHLYQQGHNYSVTSTPNSQSPHLSGLAPDPYGLSQYHHPQQNNQLQSFKDDPHGEYFNNLLNFFLEDNNSNNTSTTANGNYNGTYSQSKDSINGKRPNTVIPKELLNPPLPIAKININQAIDNDGNTIFHWACSMANYTIIDFLITNFPGIINSNVKNHNGETPLMFLIKFSNSYQLKNFPNLLDLLFDSALLVDNYNKTVLHHIALSASPPPMNESFTGNDEQVSNYMKNKERVARYYIECLFAKIIEFQEYNNDANANELIKRFINHQDSDGNTAFHLIAYNLNKKLIKIFISYHKFINFLVKNLVNYTAEEYLASHNYILKLEHEDGTQKPEKSDKTSGSESPTKIDSSGSFSMRSFDSQLYYSKMAVNLTNSTSNMVTEKLSELQYLIDKELGEKDEKLLKLININSKFQTLKLTEQRLILKIFKLDYLIKETDNVEFDLKRDKIIQDEISRFLNDLTFQVLQKREKLIKKIESYRVYYVKLVRLKVNGVEPETKVPEGDLTERVELSIDLQKQIVKSQRLVQDLVQLQPMVPVLNRDDFKENIPKTDSVIANYPVDDKLNKYCKLISLCCGMNINEVEKSIDSIELSLMRSINQK